MSKIIFRDENFPDSKILESNGEYTIVEANEGFNMIAQIDRLEELLKTISRNLKIPLYNHTWFLYLGEISYEAKFFESSLENQVDMTLKRIDFFQINNRRITTNQ